MNSSRLYKSFDSSFSEDLAQRYLRFFLCAMALFHLWLATRFGLGVDEAHYVLYGQHLDWSYFDHPPLVGWTHFLFSWIPGQFDWKARLPTILISIWTSILVFRYLRKHQFSASSSFWSVMALNLTPLFNVGSLFLLPDTLLVPLSFLIADKAEDILQEDSLKNWLLLGFYLGLAGLAKYLAILFVPALVLYFICNKKLQVIFNYKLWLGVLLAAAVVSPVLYWNLQHHFASFQYQSGHLLSFSSINIQSLFGTQVSQMLLWGIGPYLIALSSLFIYPRLNRNLAVLIAVVCLGFFFLVSFNQFVLPHWLLVSFIILIPISSAQILDNGHRKLFLISLTVSALLSFFVMLEAGFNFLPGKWTSLLYRDTYEWSNLVKNAERNLDRMSSEKKGFAVMNWTLGSRSLYYSQKNYPFFILDNRQDQFDIWNPTSPVGYDLIIMIEKENLDENLKKLDCEKLEKAEHTKVLFKGAVIHDMDYYQCTNLRALKE